jgi:starch-binding outer membrane protein, SusD/RagB family
MARILSTALVAALLSAACHDYLVVPPLNDPTAGDIAKNPITGLQLAATGILFQDRASYAGFISDVGIFGRESYNFFPTDGRTYSHYVAQNPLDPAGFATGGWAPRYTNLRTIKSFLSAVDAATALTPESQEAGRGFAETFEALELSYITAQRHDYGAVVQLSDDPTQLAPLVSRDSVQNYIIARLDEARTHLLAAGTTPFPFKLHAGFTTNGTYDAPATFLKFNRAITARVQVWRASLGNPACGAGGMTCYTAALTALTEAGTDTTASLNQGVYHVFSTEGGDVLNGLNQTANPNLLAHPSIQTDAPTDTAGQPDARYRAKIRTLSATRCSVGGENVCTNFGFQMYTTTTSPAPIFRNEELILLQAEALYFTGDAAGALANVNFIRRRSGGLAARGPFVDANDFTTELLRQRRYSLLWEGHRWVDVRRFGLVPTLPLDRPGQYRQVEMPVPQAECLQRVGATGALACPPPVPTPY